MFLWEPRKRRGRHGTGRMNQVTSGTRGRIDPGTRDSEVPAPPLARDASATLGRTTVLAATAVALLLAIAPLGLVRIPPLNDYPFHIARTAILHHWSDWPALHEFYARGTFLLPNVAMDVVLLAATWLLPIDLAGRAFAALTLTLMLSGTIALHRSLHRRWSLWPIVAALFLHNWIYLFGFMNYLFGLGLMLWGLALWIAATCRPAWQRLVIGTVVALAVFFAHIIAFGLYALAVGGFELQRALSGGRRGESWAARGGTLVIGALAFVPPLLVFLLLSPTSGEAGAQISFLPDWRDKIAAIVRTPLSMNPTLDAVTAVCLSAAALVVVLRARVALQRPMLLALGLLGLAFLAMPWKMFGGLFLDARIPVIVLFVVIASLQVEFHSAAAARLVYGGLALLLLARSVMLAGDWIAFERDYDAVTAAFAPLPDGSVIVTASAGSPQPASFAEWLERWRPPLAHVAALAQRDKPVFAANTWATASQQPITVQPAWAGLYRLQEQGPIPTQSARALAAFADRAAQQVAGAGGKHPLFLLLLEPDKLDGSPPATLHVVASARRFTLFQISGS